MGCHFFRMKITCYTGGFVQTNGYLIETPDGNLLVDAPQGIAKWLQERAVRVDDVLLTHQHYDHVEDAAAMKALGARLHAFVDYSKDLTLENLARRWGLPIKVEPYQIDACFDLSKPLHLAGMKISLAHVPGHSSDSVTFYIADGLVVFSGDTLFEGAIGRTDLPGGDTAQLLDGITQHLLILPAETRVFPGHGSGTTVGSEQTGNPYLT